MLGRTPEEVRFELRSDNEVFAMGRFRKALQATEMQWPRDRKEYGLLLRSQCESSGWEKLKPQSFLKEKKV